MIDPIVLVSGGEDITRSSDGPRRRAQPGPIREGTLIELVVMADRRVHHIQEIVSAQDTDSATAPMPVSGRPAVIHPS